MARPGAQWAVNPPPPQVAELQPGYASFKDVGWLLQAPEIHGQPARLIQSQVNYLQGRNVPTRDMFLIQIEQEPGSSYQLDAQDAPILWRRQPWVTKVPQQYGSDRFSLGHYAPFYMPMPITSMSPFVDISAFQPISRGGHVLVSMTEMDGMLPSAPTWRSFGNTRLGLWFKAWVNSKVQLPLGSRQNPSPQFRGVLPQYGYNTLPQILGA